jgi:hypothetical protein
MVMLRQAAQGVIDQWLGDCTGGTDKLELTAAIAHLQNTLKTRKPLTDEEISILWHESGGQPFKFAKMIQEVLG